jgi:hypothetical protein
MSYRSAWPAVALILVACGGRSVNVGDSGGSSRGGGSSTSGSSSRSNAGTGPGGTTGSPVACASDTCDPQAQVCCVNPGGGGPPGAACSSKSLCTGVPLVCTGSDNCPTGEVCCLQLDASGGGPPSWPPTASCQSTCEGPGGGGGPGPYSDQLCNADSQCPSGQRCQDAGSGIGMCQ